MTFVARGEEFRGSLFAEVAGMDTSVAEEGFDRFRSPVRVLARSFQRSRARWKQKYRELKEAFHRLEVRVHDTCESREQWRERTQARERELAALQAELAELQRRVGGLPSDAEKKGARTMAGAGN
jgi:hypothetical protein